jgi:recombination protein RecT
MSDKPQVSLQAYMRSGAVQERIEQLLDKRASQFTTTLMSVINANPVLQECKPETVLTAAITAASMDLPINPNLGFAYIIPYNNNKKIEEKYIDGKGKERVRTKWLTTVEAQFQMGYKGFIQLAQRSGHYKTINATDVREGEIVKEDRLTGEFEFKWIDDEKEREKLPVLGYVAYFRLNTGFEKTLFMSQEKLMKHGKKYSKSFAKGYGLWNDEFDFMARKTVLKLLISKYGPMSTAMQEAILADQATVGDDFNYVDNDKGKKSEGTDGESPETGTDPEAPDDTDQTPAEDKN